MHLLVPFAAVGAEMGRRALQELTLPGLGALLAGASAPAFDSGDEMSLSPPHERALARALGLPGADGALPWAAHALASGGAEVGDLAWGWLTPAHWVVGTDQVTMTDPQDLALDAAESSALLDAVRDLFESEGFVLRHVDPLRWALAHESLAALPTASLDRVIGRSIDPWLPRGASARSLRRLQNEVQMRLHEHPINVARVARGELPVNSFWLSGCGALGAVPTGAAPVVDDRLRGPALHEDWPAWLAAWRALDEGPLRELARRRGFGETVELTLCGESGSAHWTLPPASTWRRLLGRVRAAEPVRWLEAL
mgnify:CR=1 FL=1